MEKQAHIYTVHTHTHTCSLLPSSPPHQEFDDYLNDAMTNPAYSWEQRRERLVRWAAAPSARYAHPREEHLLPLMVAFGAARGDPALTVFNEKMMGTWVSSFQFGG